MNQHEKINYVEFAARDLTATKDFFATVFGWMFTDYGEDYTAFSHAGIEGGFYRAELNASASSGSALIVIYSSDLEQTLRKVESSGATIEKPIFSFPGGRRFHFVEPSGNEMAVWSDR